MAEELAEVFVNTDASTNLVAFYNETPSATEMTKRVFRSSNPAPHIGVMHSAVAVEHQTVGSGTNGPQSADVGFAVSTFKTGWTGSAPARGEIDGIYVSVRQSGPDSAGGADNSDASGLLLNVQSRGKTGFTNGIETTVTNIDRATSAPTRQVNAQLGVVTTLTNKQESFGLVLSSFVGTNTGGLLVQEFGPGKFTKFIDCKTTAGSQFYVDKSSVHAPALNANFKSMSVGTYPGGAPASGWRIYTNALGQLEAINSKGVKRVIALP